MIRTGAPACGSRLANGRRGLRYPSDLSDAEWVLIAPLIPPARRRGRRRSINEREDLNAIFYVLVTGCQWQALPKDLLPKSTAHFCFQLWDSDGTLDRIHEAPYVAVREAAGREASPNDAIIDSQSAKAAQKGLIGCSSGCLLYTSNTPPNHRADFKEPDLQPQDGGSQGFRRLGGRAARHKHCLLYTSRCV